MRFLKIDQSLSEDRAKFKRMHPVVEFLFTVSAFLMIATLILTVVGCDEAVTMTNGIITEPVDPQEPVEPVEPTEPQEPVEPVTDGEVKQPEPEPTPEPVEPTEPQESENLIETEVGTVNPEDIAGQMFVVTGQDRDEAEVLSGVLVTVASGPRAGEQFLTDGEGRYIFRDIDSDALHLRAEKDGLEPKEVIVHRSERTTLSDGTFFDVKGDPQNNPGCILMGYRWDDQVRFILEETALLPDLLLLLVDELPYGGTYSRQGIIITKHNYNCISLTLAHEIAHAHQHFLSFNELGISSVGVWEDTAEGRAYLKAREQDWEEVGKMGYDVGRYLDPIESAAETATHFWGLQGRLDTKRCSLANQITEENAPNRLRWAEKWLSKKY